MATLGFEDPADRNKRTRRKNRKMPMKTCRLVRAGRRDEAERDGPVRLLLPFAKGSKVSVFFRLINPSRILPSFCFH